MKKRCGWPAEGGYVPCLHHEICPLLELAHSGFVDNKDKLSRICDNYRANPEAYGYERKEDRHIT